MCNETVEVMVVVPAGLSHTCEAYYKHAKIDKCISEIVRALNRSDVLTSGSCCGHGKRPGEIILQDGRTIFIKKTELNTN